MARSIPLFYNYQNHGFLSYIQQLMDLGVVEDKEV